MPNDTIFSRIRNLRDKKSLSIRETIHQVADLNTNLLIYGETGVGKDFWVNYLFEISSFPILLNLNCGDVPENLLESEWFGYKKGAFTGADRDYDGKWKKAAGGILFLNQIDLLSLNLQSKLLRIIDRKKYYPLGSNQEKDIHARFIFSTDENIEQKVREGDFREDLYYRISPYRIRVLPLRERKKDILPLVMYFAREKQLAVSISRKAEQCLLDHPWRGNIREIENFITTVSVGKRELTDDDIFGLLKTSEDFFETVKDSDMSMAELEARYIDYLMRKYKNKATVAKILKISRKSLYNKLHR
ncbi:MAG: sigma-54-dependent Fis family transcriptional regulator [Candidatus Aminicenantes bacterium]|nr:MAG: sigma-54-dependent Fis family transcriptional regulator [Candidatus Aminicenantes bacterium]